MSSFPTLMLLEWLAIFGAGLLIGLAIGYALGDRSVRRTEESESALRAVRAAAIYYQSLSLYASAIRALPRAARDVTDPTHQLDVGRFPEPVPREILTRGLRDLPDPVRDRTAAVYAELDRLTAALRRVRDRVDALVGGERRAQPWYGRGANDSEFVDRFRVLTQSRAKALDLVEPLLKDMFSIVRPER